MKSKIKTIIGKIKERPKTYAVMAIIAVIIVGSILKKSAPKLEDIKVIKGTIVQEVSVTGKTVAVHDVTLGFEKTGKVRSAPASVGLHVREGEVLATLDSSELQANLSKAKANLSEEMVRLEQTKSQSGNSSNDARASMLASIRDAYVKSDDAIRNKIDKFFKNPRLSTNYLEFSIKDGNTVYTFPIDYDLKSKINAERYKIEKILITWELSIVNLNIDSDLKAFGLEAESNLNVMKSFLNSMALATNSLESTEFQYASTISGYKSSVSDARSEVGLALTNLITAREKLSAAPQQVVNSTGSGQSFDSVLLVEAKVLQFRAEVESAEASLAATVIRSPIDGLVTMQEAKVGQIVTAGDKIVSVISDKNMEIEANVSEVNIGKVNVGNVAVITFDAFIGQIFTGKVFYIEPAETIIDNVVNYKIKITIDGDVGNIKSGLTANLKLKTASKDGVLKVPQYAITEDNGKTVINTLVSGKTRVIPVTVGLVGNDGMVEITSGLSEGEDLQVSLVK